jgi:hypothetical protein
MNQAWTDLENSTMNPDVYAKTVFTKVVKPNPPEQFFQNKSSSVKIMIRHVISNTMVAFSA